MVTYFDLVRKVNLLNFGICMCRDKMVSFKFRFFLKEDKIVNFVVWFCFQNRQNNWF